MNGADGQSSVPQALIQALFHRPDLLQLAMDEAGLAPHELAMWARQTGDAREIEKLAGWLAVGLQPGHFKPLLEAASSHLRAGDLLDAVLVFRWAYRTWELTPPRSPTHCAEGVKLLGQWGECLYRMDKPQLALDRWLHALDFVVEPASLQRLARTIERLGAADACREVLLEATKRRLPGAQELWRRWQRLMAQAADADGRTDAASPPATGGRGVAVLADVANLDQVCGDQYGYGRLLDYGRLLQAAQRHGLVCAKIAFTPDLPDTLGVRRHLQEVGFEIDLKRPKRSNGRITANADTAMAAQAVRWASASEIDRVEMWTGDGDFLAVRSTIRQAWPQVTVAFRSFPVGTAHEIQQLEGDWEPIGPQWLQGMG
jgi:hypothetical protein